MTLLGGERGLVRLMILAGDKRSLKAEIRQLERKEIQLQTELTALSFPSYTMEKRIRESLDWVRKGETVYKFSAP